MIPSTVRVINSFRHIGIKFINYGDNKMVICFYQYKQSILRQEVNKFYSCKPLFINNLFKYEIKRGNILIVLVSSFRIKEQT